MADEKDAIVAPPREPNDDGHGVSPEVAKAAATESKLEDDDEVRPAGGIFDGSDPSKVHRNVIEHARAAAAKEQKMTLMQGVRLYPKAIFWSVIISTCIVMEGYQISLVNNFCEPAHHPSLHVQPTDISPDAFPQFNEKYGKQLPSGEWEVPAPWQAGLSNVSSRQLPLEYPWC